MKKKNICLLIFFAVATITTFYLGGCEKSLTSEPKETLKEQNNTNSVGKFSDKEILRRKLLLEKFKKEVDESIKKVKSKWAEFKNNQLLKKTMLLPEEQIMDYSNAIVGSSYSYINDAYGVDLHQYFETDDPNINIVSFSVAACEQSPIDGMYWLLDDEDYVLAKDLTQNEPNRNSLKNKKITQSMLLPRGSITYCVFEALGVNLIVRDFASYVSAKSIIRFVSKLAGKYAGWFGAASAVWDFMDCMDWV